MTECDSGGETAGVVNVCFFMPVHVYTLSLDIQKNSSTHGLKRPS